MPRKCVIVGYWVFFGYWILVIGYLQTNQARQRIAIAQFHDSNALCSATQSWDFLQVDTNNLTFL